VFLADHHTERDGYFGLDSEEGQILFPDGRTSSPGMDLLALGRLPIRTPGKRRKYLSIRGFGRD